MRIKVFRVFNHTTMGMLFKLFNPFCIMILRFRINS